MGTSVEVVRRVVGSTDRFGDATYTETTETVDNVLIAPGFTSEFDADRPEGVSVAYTLHFPKTYTAELGGAYVVIDGERYRVIGKPKAYMGANTPTPWDRPCEVEKVDG